MVNERTIKAITEMNKDIRKILRKFKPHEKGRLQFDFNARVRALRNLFKRKLKELMADSRVWLIDYTAQSTTILRLKKNRYLLTPHGRYFVKGYVVALNVITRKLMVLETDKRQMTTQDINKLRKYLPPNHIAITDKQHTHATNGTKKITQLIEDYFGGMKKPIYAEIRILQKNVKGYIVTSMSYEQLNDIYTNRWKELNATIVRKAHPRIERKNLKVR